eukprot:tig00000842_g4884.t1
MSTPGAVLRPFVSGLVVQHLLRSRRAKEAPPGDAGGEEAGPSGPPLERRLRGVVALLDISGFTVLCERAHTDEGLMEELCALINGAFSREIEVVQSYGGEVLCFLGDGLLVFWPLHDDDAGPPPAPAPAAGGGERGGRGAGGLSGLLSGAAGLEREAPDASLASTPPLSPSALSEAGDAAGPEAPVEAMRLRAARAVLCALEVQDLFSSACTGLGAGMRLRVAVAAGEFREYFCGIGAAPAGEAAPESALVDERGHLGAPRPRPRPPPRSPAPQSPAHGPRPAPPARPRATASRAQWLPPPRSSPCGASPQGRRPLPDGVRSPGSDAETPLSPGSDAGPHARSSSRADLAPPPLRPRRRRRRPLRGARGGAGAGKGRNGRRAGAARRGQGGGRSGREQEAARGAVVAHASSRESLHPLAWAAPLAPAPAALGEEEEDQLALYVPYTVRARFAEMRGWGAGAPGAFDPTAFLSEFRVVSVLFCKLEGLVAAPEAVQRCTRTLQAVLYSHEGSLRQIVLDDKGLVFIGVFGLWPIAHEDDALRSVACGP